MKLFEIMQQPVGWEWTRKEDGHMWLAEFDIGEYHYRVRFMPEVVPTEHTGHDDDYDDDYDDYPRHGDMTTEIDFDISKAGSRNGSFGVTNTGNAFTVFSTVLDIIQNFVKASRCYSIMFSAKEQSRAKLYQQMIRRFASSGWDVEELHFMPERTWVLRKK